MFDCSQFVSGSHKFSVGFLQSSSFGFDIAVDLEELDDVDDPRAKAGGRGRLRADELRVKLLILQVWVQGYDDVGVNVFLVVVNKAFLFVDEMI